MHAEKVAQKLNNQTIIINTSQAGLGNSGNFYFLLLRQDDCVIIAFIAMSDKIPLKQNMLSIKLFIVP